MAVSENVRIKSYRLDGLVFFPTKLLQSCLILCNPTDQSPPGSFVLGILQARILERAAMPSSRGSSRLRNQTRISYVSCTDR